MKRRGNTLQRHCFREQCWTCSGAMKQIWNIPLYYERQKPIMIPHATAQLYHPNAVPRGQTRGHPPFPLSKIDRWCPLGKAVFIEATRGDNWDLSQQPPHLAQQRQRLSSPQSIQTTSPWGAGCRLGYPNSPDSSCFRRESATLYRSRKPHAPNCGRFLCLTHWDPGERQAQIHSAQDGSQHCPSALFRL